MYMKTKKLAVKIVKSLRSENEFKSLKDFSASVLPGAKQNTFSSI